MKYPDDFLNKVVCGDCINILKDIPSDKIDTIICDPPYEISFMSKGWDNTGVAFQKSTWQECLRVAKPGATLLCFGGTRTHHRLMVAIEDAGWVIKDVICWIYGSGFPKSFNIGKAVDKLQGNKREVIGYKSNVYPDSDNWGKESNLGHGFREQYVGDKIPEKTFGFTPIEKPTSEQAREWEGWGTALKPAVEFIVVAMKPNEGSYCENALRWGVAGLNIEQSRIGYQNDDDWNNTFRPSKNVDKNCWLKESNRMARRDVIKSQGRFPTNLILECICDEVREGVDSSPKTYKRNSMGKNKDIYGKGIGEDAGKLSKNYGGNKSIIHTNPECPCAMLDRQSGKTGAFAPVKSGQKGFGGTIYGKYKQAGDDGATFYGDGLSGASRFFYQAKASRSERNMGCEELYILKDNVPKEDIDEIKHLLSI